MSTGPENPVNVSKNRSAPSRPNAIAAFFARYGVAFQQRDLEGLVSLFRTPLPIVTPYATVLWSDEQAVRDGLESVCASFDTWEVKEMAVEELKSTPAGPMFDVVVDWRLDTERRPRTLRTGYWVTPVGKGLAIAAVMLIEEPRERPLL